MNEWTKTWEQWKRQTLTCCKWSVTYRLVHYFLPGDVFALAPPTESQSRPVLKYYTALYSRCCNFQSLWVCVCMNAPGVRGVMRWRCHWEHSPLASLSFSLFALYSQHEVFISARVIIVTVSQHGLPRNAHTLADELHRINIYMRYVIRI